MRKGTTLARVEVPLGVARVAQTRCRPMVRHYSNVAGYGTFDLDALALSCYLQGLNDGFQIVANHPEIAAPLIEGAREETMPVPNDLGPLPAAHTPRRLILPDTFRFTEPGAPCTYWRSNGAHIITAGACRCGLRVVLHEEAK